MVTLVVFELGKTLEYFDNAGTDQTPRGLVCLLRSLYERLGRNSALLAWPQADYNFTIRNYVETLKRLFANMGPNAKMDGILAKYKGPADFVSFPRIERDNVLMHAIFGHELGHPIATDFLTQESAKPEYATKELEIRNEVSAALGAANSLAELHTAMQTVFALRFRALEELISDTVGIYLFGPSALFAGYEINLWALDVVPSAGNDCYPPGRMRIRVCLEAARSLKHLAVLANHSDSPSFRAAASLTDQLAALAAEDSDKKAIETNALAKIAYKWVDASLSDAQAFAKQAVGSAVYEDAIFEAEVPDLVGRLKNGLPPNELGNSLNPRRVDERSAILAAWLAVLEESQSPTATTGSTDDVARLNEKTLRALEYIVLEREYREWGKTR